ncbi:MAG: hypothetical protein Q9223_004441 [Gallowayella weberi]
MLDKDNEGLHHVQKLVLKDDHQHSSFERAPEIPEPALYIYLLPKNTLRRVKWVSWCPMPSKLTRTLLSRQRSLTSLELIWSDISIDEMIGPYSDSSCLLHGLKDVEQLRIMPGRRERMPQVACDFFKENKTIRSLQLDLIHMASEVDDGDTDEHYTSGSGIHALFGSLQPSSAPLHTLALTGVNFDASHHELLTALDLQVLSNLSVIKCEHPEKFFTALGEKAKRDPISLKRLIIHHSRPYMPSPSSSTDLEHDKDKEPLLFAINLLLMSLNGCLKKIWIYLRGFDCPPHVEGLIHHGSALHWLFVDARREKGTTKLFPYSFEEWQRLCNHLENIRQLDMIFPNVMADGRTFWHNNFCRYVEATAVMKKLTTLGINNWPERWKEDTWDQRSVNNTLYRHCLSWLATELANLRLGQHDPPMANDYIPITGNREPGLRVVSFGLREELENKANLGFRIHPMLFVKSRVEVMGGEVKWKMEPVTRQSLDWNPWKERDEYDIDSMAREVGKFEFGVDPEES